MAQFVYIEKGKWIAGISGGLILPCGICGRHTNFVYAVDDKVWEKLVPKEHRLGVVCLTCLDKLGQAKGIDIAPSLVDVQFTGINKTIELKPTRVFYYSRE